MLKISLDGTRKVKFLLSLKFNSYPECQESSDCFQVPYPKLAAKETRVQESRTGLQPQFTCSMVPATGSVISHSNNLNLCL